MGGVRCIYRVLGNGGGGQMYIAGDSGRSIGGDGKE